jgi:hypothetical protein
VQDRPTATELLEAVRRFLEEDVVPVLAGGRRFHARVAANVLGIVGREIAGEEKALVAEWHELAALLGHPAGEAPRGRDALAAAVREWTAELAARIRRGDADAGPFGHAVRAHVRETVRAKLRVANPGYLGVGEGGADGH